MEPNELNAMYAEARNLTATAFKEFLSAMDVLIEKRAAWKEAQNREIAASAAVKEALGYPKPNESYE